MPPQQKRSNRIRRMLSHPHPLSEFPKRPLFPHPPQKESKIIIQIMELHPNPLLLEAVEEPHPQPVAVKSLIVLPPKGLFMLYHMNYGLYVFPQNLIFLEKFFCTIC